MKIAGAIAVSLLALSGCTLAWNEGEPGVVLSGAAPSLDSFQKLNERTAGHANLIQGRTGAYYTAFCEFWSGSGSGVGRNCRRARVARLGVLPEGVPPDEVLEGDDFTLRYRMVYIGKNDKANKQRVIRAHRPGDPADRDKVFTFPEGQAIFYINWGGWDDVFVYWWLDERATFFEIYRIDGKYQRRIPIPAGVDRLDPGKTIDFDLTWDGRLLIFRDPKGNMTAYSTLDETATPLGKRPPLFILDDSRNQFLTLGDDGFRAVPYDGSPERLLTDDPIDTETLAFTAAHAWYVRDGDLWRVPLDGSGPSERAQPGAARLLGFGPKDSILYSKDPANRYINGVGDGWIGDSKVIQRGRTIRWSRDGKRLRFLEWAAQATRVGELTSLPLVSEGGDGVPLILGLNVRQYDELPDGRVLAIENAVQPGTWNRLVAVDEEARKKRWVTPAATQFFVVPGGKELVVDVVSGASGYDIYKVPVPPGRSPD